MYCLVNGNRSITQKIDTSKIYANIAYTPNQGPLSLMNAVFSSLFLTSSKLKSNLTINQ